jgi:hypothetical protein
MKSLAAGAVLAAARTADQARRRAMFEGALRNMKALAEGK